MHQSPRPSLHLGKTTARILIVVAVAAFLALANVVPLLPPARGQPLQQGPEQTSTVWGTLGVLKLMGGDVSALTPEMRAKLGLHGHIAIVKQSPVYDAIQRYLDDASVRNFFVEAGKEGTITSSVNDGQSTFSSFVRPDKSSEQETQRQSSRQFERDGIIDENSGYTTADLAQAIKPFSTNIEDAMFTSYSRNGANGWVDQYPALSSIKSYNQQFRPSGDRTSKGQPSPNPWLSAIIQANPNLRGLIGYRYYFDTTPDLSRRGGCGVPTNVVRQFIPYAKFIVFNPNQDSASQPLRFKLTLNRADKTPYAISSAENPSSRSTRSLDINAHSTLKAGTSLILPVEFGFQYIAGNDTPEPQPWINPVFVRSVRGENLESLKLTAPFVAAMKTNERQIPISHRLLVGSTIDRVSVASAQPLNDQKVAVLNMSHMMGIGSCPFLVYYDRSNKYWVDYGTVLVDRKDKTLQGEEIHLIRRDVSKIRIEEREDEVTSIDSISLAYRDAKGQEIILKAQDPQLQHTDGQYATLRKGDRLEIVFSALPPGVSDVSVRINGYYIPESAGR